MVVELILALWVLGFGLIVGSFLNVCIYRLPKELSIVWPGSACPRCRRHIAWYDNVPVLSYFFLGRKCRHCKAKISARYPLIESLTGLLFLTVYFRFQDQWGWMAIGWALTGALIVCTFIDFEHFIIPDVISLPGIVLGLLIHLMFPTLSGGDHNRWQAFLWALEGIAAGGGFLWLVAVVGRWFYGKDVMGLGDVKLMAMVGALLGWKSVLLAIFFGSLAGSTVGIILIGMKKSKWQSHIPFGPYLSLGTLAAFLAGEPLVHWYFRTLFKLHY